MMRNILQTLRKFIGIKLLLALLFLSQSCDDFPNSFVAPSFNSAITFPLLDSVVTVDNMLQDTSLLKKDGKGNLVLTQEAVILPNTIGDSLKLREIPISYQSAINDHTAILESTTLWTKPKITLANLFPTLPPPPASGVIPPLPTGGQYVETPILPPDQVEYANFQRAEMTIILDNFSPISFTLGTLSGKTSPGFMISTPGQSDIFVPLNDIQRSIPTGQTRGDTNSPGGEIIVPITNQKLSQDSRIKFVVLSSGSNGTAVHYDGNSYLRCMLRFKNTKLHQAKVAFGSRTLQFRVESPFPDNAILTQAQIKNFTAKLTYNNGFPISGKATIRLPQLRRLSDGSILTTSFVIGKKSFEPLTVSSGSNRYNVVPDSLDIAKNGGKITALHFFLDLVTDSIPLNSKEIFDENDFFKLQGTISAIQFASVRGTSLPQTEIHVSSETEFKMQGNLNKITFDRLLVESSSVEIKLINSAAVQAVFSGTAYLLGKNGNVITTVHIPSQTIQPASIVGDKTIPVETLLNISLGSLTIPEFPKASRISGIVRTVSNAPFFVSDTNYFGGTAEVRIPLTINVSGGKFTNEIPLSIAPEIKEREKNVTSAMIMIEAKNRIPANVIGYFQFFDENNRVLLRLPKGESLSFASAHFDANGVSDGETKTGRSIILDSADIAHILKASKYTLYLNFDAQNSNSNYPYIKFFTSDYIHVRSTLEFKGNTDAR